MSSELSTLFLGFIAGAALMLCLSRIRRHGDNRGASGLWSAPGRLLGRSPKAALGVLAVGILAYASTAVLSMAQPPSGPLTPPAGPPVEQMRPGTVGALASDGARNPFYVLTVANTPGSAGKREMQVTSLVPQQARVEEIQPDPGMQVTVTVPDEIEPNWTVVDYQVHVLILAEGSNAVYDCYVDSTGRLRCKKVS